MILNCLRPVLDPLLRPQQNGFREKRMTIEQILALRRIIEGVRNRNLPAIMTFIDFKKAFDTVHRGKLIHIQRAYSIPDKLVQAISRYEHTRAKVNSPDGETETFNIHTGVLQGDTLAPYLFIIVLDHALRKAIAGCEEELGFTLALRSSRRVPAVIVTDFDYADDITLISNTAEQARQHLLAVETECLRVGLQLNSKKTKVLAFNTNDIVVCTRNGETLKVEEDFRYLSAWISSSLKNLKTRRAIAWKVLHDMRRMWKSELSRKIKRKLFVSTVESVLLYGAETWTLTAAQEKSLDGCYTRMLHMAQDVFWMEHMSNVDLYVDLPLVTSKIRQRRLRLAGHSVRHPDLIASKLVLWEPTHGKATRGAKRITYTDMLRKDTSYASTDELRSGMLDWDVWRGVISRARVAPVASTLLSNGLIQDLKQSPFYRV
ncbi:hypothetical protein SKAU_G00063450 [Synaphobranchus kaupii]|uniref:ribonuclease H n=1 Tax=Synaphobranchus kaupii TaxID=118154 RepID=A0A9Q1JAZ1_SYNKA|nr:hypothetical protein SKAU_G00063450 [Synaphobranchus kaupii]